MNAILSSLVTGVISGIVASLVFTLIMYNLRPKVKISPEINRTEYRDDGIIFYGIKILNNSRFTGLLDVRAELVLMTPFNAHGGPNFHMDDIPLKSNYLAHCNKYSKKDKEGAYAVIFTTPVDIDSLWKTEGQFITFNIYAKHPFSGFSKAFEQKYYTKRDCIKNGRFTFGNKFDIS
jgi:hypothetical protein